MVLLAMSNTAHSKGEVSKDPKHSIYIDNTSTPNCKKEAMILLPGFSDSKKRRKKQIAYFSTLGYDVYIPDYHNRKSYNLTVENFEQFYFDYNIDEYAQVHVFSYILGTWVLNNFIDKNGKQNISTIVYDRSPLQERAPIVTIEKIPFLAKLAKGKLLFDFNDEKYIPNNCPDIRIGIIVENKATALIRFFKKKTLSYGPIDWNPASLNQRYDDLMHTPLNHDQMYYRFDIVGSEIVNFIEHGRFTESAKRVPFDWDPFKKWKGKDAPTSHPAIDLAFIYEEFNK